ncbi:Flavodoxin-like fold family protein [Trichomonas vaginalis G3]|uniref:Flavodoxin-like fold family protein n=1 Tax=Trichomonas vaginalis (strain ATCC PRA-98 / G3) TaxID=412133 RepID=A2F3Z2_TRIV3|nr:flavodoxin-like fold family protein [Trichomonas vaginalis G3]EAY00346.1 Flavodoxin-like fold family protein [Trichomonas vaginalis G3]KAI5552328.1 flavodoxin-like fold family protein [Trichomonas vaginalis G3]|eukprot:XP_001313275.1 Flavodoxin-like fold family protein [Trichomonas vaginalis G3]
MRVLILVAHPDPTHEATSFRFALSAKAALEAAGNEVRYVNLIAEGFDKAGSAGDFKQLKTDPFTYDGNQMIKDNLIDCIKVQQENLLWSTHVVIFAPLWFGRLPSCFYCYTERVLSFPFAYDYENYIEKGFLKGRKVTSIISTGVDSSFFDPKNGNTLDAYAWSAMYGFDYSGFTILRSLGIYSAVVPEMIKQQPELMKKINEKIVKLDQWKTVGSNKCFNALCSLEEVTPDNILVSE